MIKLLASALLIGHIAIASAVPLGSQYAIVVDEASGDVLLAKNATDIVPIASLTKLMTAMLVLDADLDMQELITIDQADVDTLKNSSSRVPVGAMLTRQTLLELALMSSDNRAAAALARTYPGELHGYRAAARDKAHALGMRRTYIEEPTGLSPYNTSTAADLAKLAQAAASYSEIARMSTVTGDVVDMNGRAVEYRNTNRLIGTKDWDIQLSKTGFTREAGRCIIMRVQTAGRNVIMVLLNARETAIRTVDAVNLKRFLTGEPPIEIAARAAPRKTSKAKASKRSRYAVAKNDRKKARKSSKQRSLVTAKY
jgi:D-alanyl-D-alanine endopeptidase (penicillin-binding protein 7)